MKSGYTSPFLQISSILASVCLYKTYKDASKEQQRLSDEIDQMKFNKEEIEKKKESVEIQGVHIKAAIRKRKYTFECYKTVGRTQRDE